MPRHHDTRTSCTSLPSETPHFTMVGDADELVGGVDVRDEVDVEEDAHQDDDAHQRLDPHQHLSAERNACERARLWFRFWAWARGRAALAARAGGSRAWRTVTAGGTT